ncbi:MAG: DUF6172 family protein [Opitutaceae bacterium]
MKKTFSLHDPVKADARVLDAIKHEVRKYVRREHRKPLPEGFNRLDFDCKVGASADDAAPVALPDVSAALDAVARAGGPAVYIEIASRPAQRLSTRTATR